MMLLQGVVLAVIQSITEFLPISSSAHLALLPRIVGWIDQGLAFDAALHFGTLLAVFFYFRRQMASMISAVMHADRNSPWHGLFFKLLLASVPALIVGYIAKDLIGGMFRNPVMISVQLIFWGVVLGLADYSRERRAQKGRKIQELSWNEIFIVGLAQVLAFMPGVSRSGITISAALFQNLSRQTAAEVSFLVGLPVMAAASLWSLFQLGQQDFNVSLSVSVVVSMLVSFGLGWVVLRFFFSYLARHRLLPFVVYRVVLGVILLVLFLPR